MWCKLTKTDGQPALVNFSKITHVAPRTGGGSTLHFETKETGASASKQPMLAVKEDVSDIAAQTSAGSVSKASKR